MKETLVNNDSVVGHQDTTLYLAEAFGTKIFVMIVKRILKSDDHKKNLRVVAQQEILPVINIEMKEKKERRTNCTDVDDTCLTDGKKNDDLLMRIPQDSNRTIVDYFVVGFDILFEVIQNSFDDILKRLPKAINKNCFVVVVVVDRELDY